MIRVMASESPSRQHSGSRVSDYPGAARGTEVAEVNGGGVELWRAWVAWRPLLTPHAINDAIAQIPLPHLEAIRDQSLGLDGGRRCPDLG